MLIQKYYRITKPGIVYGNLLTTTAGFFLGSKNSVDFSLLLFLLSGTALVIASGCVFNNIIDRDIDKLMTRTKVRPLVQNSISIERAFLFGSTLGISGFVVLLMFTNTLTFIAGLVGFVSYLAIYSYWKRRTSFATLLGSISGSMPPIAGYAASANQFDLVALLLFLVLFFWQMAHFYAIAIYRFDEYKKANIPLWPIVRGVLETKMQILFFTIAFGSVLVLFNHFGYSSFWFLVPTFIVFLLWLKLSLEGFQTKNDKNWARRFFLFSQLVILTFSVFISIDAFLH